MGLTNLPQRLWCEPNSTTLSPLTTCRIKNSERSTSRYSGGSMFACLWPCTITIYLKGFSTLNTPLVKQLPVVLQSLSNLLPGTHYTSPWTEAHGIYKLVLVQQFDKCYTVIKARLPEEWKKVAHVSAYNAACELCYLTCCHESICHSPTFQIPAISLQSVYPCSGNFWQTKSMSKAVWVFCVQAVPPRSIFY
jgi:hypothetical protein